MDTKRAWKACVQYSVNTKCVETVQDRDVSLASKKLYAY